MEVIHAYGVYFLLYLWMRKHLLFKGMRYILGYYCKTPYRILPSEIQIIWVSCGSRTCDISNQETQNQQTPEQ